MSTEALAESNDDSTFTKDIKRRILIDIKSRYMDPEIDELLDTACILDRRFKVEHIFSENLDSIKTRIRDEGVRSLDHAPDSESIAVPQEQGETEAQPQPPPKKRKLASILKKKKDDTTATVSPRSQVEKEIANYLNAPDLDVESNPLLWWKCEAPRYPILPRYSILSKLAKKYLSVCATSDASEAKKYLSVCATSDASERVLSSSGKIVTPLRTNLKPDINKLDFLPKNL